MMPNGFARPCDGLPPRRDTETTYPNGTPSPALGRAGVRVGELLVGTCNFRALSFLAAAALALAKSANAQTVLAAPSSFRCAARRLSEGFTTHTKAAHATSFLLAVPR